eukprot:m.59125 g.59125  ORF g.59125 m.59125 type:complete len:380 (-) comp13206_c0_seq3:1892-3031(-)
MASDRLTSWIIYTSIVSLLITALLLYQTSFRQALARGLVYALPYLLSYTFAVFLFFSTSISNPGVVLPSSALRRGVGKGAFVSVGPSARSSEGSFDSYTDDELLEPFSGDAASDVFAPQADTSNPSRIGSQMTTPMAISSPSFSSTSAVVPASLSPTSPQGLKHDDDIMASSAAFPFSSSFPVFHETSTPLLDSFAPEQQFCRVCQMYQPMRAKHCYDCRRCVRKFDHHCPFIGQCIGERNHKLFWAFLLVHFLVVFQIFISLWSAWELPVNGIDLDWLAQYILLLIGLCTAGCAAAASTSLLLCHSYLAMNNTTMWESLSRRRIPYLKSLKRSENPFDEGVIMNLRRFFLTPSREDISWEKVYARFLRRRRLSSSDIV